MPDTTQHSTSALRDAGLHALAFSRRLTDGLVASTPEELFCAVPCEGGNHAAWVAGHIAVADDGFRHALGGGDRLLDGTWDELFGNASVCRPDASLYPSKADLADALARTREALVSWVGTLDDGRLLEPIQGDMSRFAANRGQMMAFLAWHEGFHGGQLSAARRAAGLGPLF